MEIQWNSNGNPMEIQWNSNGIPMEFNLILKTESVQHCICQTAVQYRTNQSYFTPSLGLHKFAETGAGHHWSLAGSTGSPETGCECETELAQFETDKSIEYTIHYIYSYIYLFLWNLKNWWQTLYRIAHQALHQTTCAMPHIALLQRWFSNDRHRRCEEFLSTRCKPGEHLFDFNHCCMYLSIHLFGCVFSKLVPSGELT